MHPPCKVSDKLPNEDILRLFSVLMDGDSRGNHVFDKYKHVVSHNGAIKVSVTKVGSVQNVGQVIVRLETGFPFICDTGSGSSLMSEKQHDLFCQEGMTDCNTLQPPIPGLSFESASGDPLEYIGDAFVDVGVPGADLQRIKVIKNFGEDFYPILGNDALVSMGGTTSHRTMKQSFLVGGQKSTFSFNLYGPLPRVGCKSHHFI